MEFGFLLDKEINNDLIKTGFNPARREGASYDLSLGDEVYISGQEYPIKLSLDDPIVRLPRGQFALLMTDERINMPDDCLGLISIKFHFKVEGLINISGFHVDPGFKGKIFFSVFNAGPSDVALRYKEPIFMIFFYKLHGKVDIPYKGDMKDQEHLPTKFVTSLKGTSASLADVDKRVSSLEVINKILIALLIALVAGLIGLALRVILFTNSG